MRLLLSIIFISILTANLSAQISAIHSFEGKAINEKLGYLIDLSSDGNRIFIGLQEAATRKEKRGKISIYDIERR